MAKFQTSSFLKVPNGIAGARDINSPLQDIGQAIADRSPEGVVAGVPGSFCQVRGAPPGNDDGLWAKVSGTGITGWSKLVVTPTGVGNIVFSGGAQSASLSAITFANSGNVSFGLNAGVMTATASFSTSPGGIALGAGGVTATSGTVTLSNANGLTFGMAGNVVTGSYTTPSTAGLLSAIRLSAGTQSSNLSAITLSNANGFSFGLNAGVVTGSYTTPSTAGLLSGVVFSAGSQSTNGTGLTFSNSNGLAFGLNAGTITGSYTVPSTTAAITLLNLVGVGSTLGGPSVDFIDGNGVSWNKPGGGKIGASVAGAVTLSTYEPYPLGNQGTQATLSLGSVSTGAQSMYPFEVHAPVAAEYMRMVFAASLVSAGTDNFAQSATMNWGLFTRGTGVNASLLQAYVSSSLTINLKYSNSSMSITHPVSTLAGGGYSTGSTGSAGTGLISNYTGSKLFDLGLGVTLPPNEYWLGLQWLETGGKGSGLRMTLVGASQGLTNLAPLGSASANYQSGTNVGLDVGGNWHLGNGQYVSGAQTGLSTNIALSQITQNGTMVPYLKFATRV